MEGSDALLAARLAAGDDHALAEVFDQLARGRRVTFLPELQGRAVAVDLSEWDEDGGVRTYRHALTADDIAHFALEPDDYMAYALKVAAARLEEPA